ncbi:hypothetical protein ACKWRH_08965 [Bradyrhizobium sp. Pa8]|uniref:hypothetical protein n=1 Tax=Bradyrhizobium sp. Pa8 TaxID=3386552 RepID=UPI00403F614A
MTTQMAIVTSSVFSPGAEIRSLRSGDFSLTGIVTPSKIRPRGKPGPPIVGQVTILSKAALCLQPSRMVQRLKEAPEPAFLSGSPRGGDKRTRRKQRIASG